jgi:glucose/arabinose dehydrogenase
LAHAGDDRLFATLRDGRIFILEESGKLNSQPFLDIRNRVETGFWEQGLLGLVFHPGFATNGYFYVYYTANNLLQPVAPAVLARFRSLDGRTADPASEQRLLVFPHDAGIHYGGALHFGPDGYLYVATGDGTDFGGPGPFPSPPYAQDGASLLGKILRLDVDGGLPYEIPPDNPYVGDDGVRDEIWLMGLRNPWRFSFDRLTGEMYIADVGYGRQEEIDLIPAGASGLNLGWPCYEGILTVPTTPGCGPASNYMFPIHHYNHGTTHCAVTGGYVYRGRDYPALTGRYLFADLCSGALWTLVVAPHGVRSAVQVGAMPDNRLTTFGENAQGELFAGEFAGSVTVFQVVLAP